MQETPRHMMEVLPTKMDIMLMIRCMQSKLVLNIKNNLEDSLVLHYNNYDRQYENGGYLDTYYSEVIYYKR